MPRQTINAPIEVHHAYVPSLRDARGQPFSAGPGLSIPLAAVAPRLECVAHGLGPGTADKAGKQGTRKRGAGVGSVHPDRLLSPSPSQGNSPIA